MHLRDVDRGAVEQPAARRDEADAAAVAPLVAQPLDRREAPLAPARTADALERVDEAPLQGVDELARGGRPR